MKKNLFSDNRKGSKGFYAALGISAVMIGSACYFAYGQSEKMTRDITEKAEVSAPEKPVAKRETNVPKMTAATYRVTVAPVTTRAVTAAPPATLPAADIQIDEPPAQEEALAAEETAAAKLADPKPPLEDISNIITDFSRGELVRNETTGTWATHNGTDIAAEVGSDVYSVSAGEVTSVDNDPLWGVTVTVDHHNGYVSRYCGLSQALSVQKGDTLVSGDLIGTIGNTADIESSLTPHLHIEMLHNGSYIDPISEIR